MFKKTKQVQDPDAIGALETRVAKLEHDLKIIDTEWSEMFDKFRRLHMRLAKRDQRASEATSDTNGDQPGGKAPPPMNPLAARLLHGSNS